MSLFAYGTIVLSLVVAGFAGWHVVRGYRFSNPLFYAVGGLETALVAFLIYGSVALARTSSDVEGVLFISYLITAVVIPPAAVLWGVGDQSRWSTGVVVIAMVTVAALVLRVLQIWQVGQ